MPHNSSTPHALYIHIPFCDVICSYCAFNTYANDPTNLDKFVQAVIMELEIVARSQPNIQLSSIYFGGGTPSLLKSHHVEMIFRTINQLFQVKATEIGIETNPNDLTPNYAQMLKDIGFNRISVGMQSAIERDLELFKRQHNLTEVETAIKNLRDAKIDNINLDLIFGVPNQTLADWQQTLDIALSYEPQHLSLYGLELHGGTDLTKAIDDGKLPEPDEDLAVSMYEYATEKLAEQGFIHYEISNWMKPNHESAHNVHYWRNLPYLGIGPGAHGYANNHRTIVMRLPQRYIDSLMTVNKTEYDFPRTPATSKLTSISLEDEISETIMMNMRLLIEGLDRQAFKTRFGHDITHYRQAEIDALIERDLVELNENTLRLTRAGQLLSNLVLRDLV